MLRTSIRNTLRPVLRTPSLVTVRMAGGDTGAPRSGGTAQGDAFTKREKASEDMYVKEQERQKLQELRAKVAEQSKHLKELDEHIESLQKEQGGEHN